MKKLSLLFAALFCLLTVNARTIYLNTSIVDYPKDGALLAFWTWGGSSPEAWSVFTAVDGATNLHSAEIADDRTGGKIIRFAAGTTVPAWENTTQWNSTGDLTIPADKNMLTLQEWNGETGGQWSTYDGSTPPPTPETYSFTVKFHNNLGWEEVYFFAWGTGVTTAGWPGDKLTADNDGWYTYEFTEAVPSFIFSNGAGTQTIDIVGYTADVCLELGEKSGNNYTVSEIDCDQSWNDQAVESITLSDETLKIQPNQHYTLSATVAPISATNKAITWASSNEAVATVDAQGRISTLTVGEATISATAQDGSAVKDECVVTVSEDADALAGITLYFKKHADWEKVSLWAWTGTGTNIVNFFDQWPGQEITNADSEGVYSYTFDANYSSVSFILNDGKAEKALQTTDRTIEENTCVIVEKDADKYVATIVDCETWAPAVIHVENLSWYELYSPEATMYVGDFQYLAVAINPNTATNQALTFASSTDGIVQDSLYVHKTGGYPVLELEGLAAGQTTITLTSVDNPLAILSFDLTVTERSVTALETVTTEVEVRKVIEHGTLYIIREGVKYNIMGVRIQ